MMSRWPQPSLEPAREPRPSRTETRSPGSLSSSQEDGGQWRPCLSKRQLPPFLAILVYCLSQALWVRIYTPLLGLSVAVAELASHYLSVSVVWLYILWRSGFQTAGALTLILARKFCGEVVAPMFQAVRQPWLEMKAWALAFFCTFVRWAWGCAWNLQRNLSRQAGMAVCSWAKRAYGCLVSFCQAKGKDCEVILSSILRPLFSTLLLSCLHGLCDVLFRGVMVIRDKSCWLLDGARQLWGRRGAAPSLEACLSSLASSSLPRSQRFPGPEPSALSGLPPDSGRLSFLVEQRNTEEGVQDCGWAGSSRVPLNTRFQSRTALSSSAQTLVLQVKTACVLVILLYIYGVALFVQIIK